MHKIVFEGNMGFTRLLNSYGTNFKVSRNAVEVLKYEMLGF